MKNVRVEKFPLSLNVFSHVLPVPVQVMLVYLVVAYVNYRLQSLLQVPSRQISGRKKKVIVKLFLLGIAGTSFLGVLWCVFVFFLTYASFHLLLYPCCNLGGRNS